MTVDTGRTLGDRVARDLRETLVEAARQMGADDPLADPRRAARHVGIQVASNVDAWWRRDARPGPVAVVDMFSGAGGMSAGFRLASAAVGGYRLAGAVEIDAIANESYRRNLGPQPLAQDVAALARDARLLHRRLGSMGVERNEPLVLIGCAPCQGFSSHRNAAGRSDLRNSLFIDFATIAARLRPSAILVENVPELLTDQYWPFVEEAKRILRRAGYRLHLGVHNMAAFGVPQERFRTLLLALPKAFHAPSGFLRRDEYRTVRQAIGALRAVRAGERDPEDEMHYSAGHKESTLETIRAVPKNGGSRPDDVGPECLRRAKEKNGRAAYEDVYGRLFWDRPSITVTAYARNPASGRFVHPQQDRGLTVREAALLQSFPSNYWFAGGLDDRFRQIGNAVPPAFAAYVANHLLGEFLACREPVHEDAGIEAPVGASFSRLIPALKAGSRTEGHIVRVAAG